VRQITPFVIRGSFEFFAEYAVSPLSRLFRSSNTQLQIKDRDKDDCQRVVVHERNKFYNRIKFSKWIGGTLAFSQKSLTSNSAISTYKPTNTSAVKTTAYIFPNPRLLAPEQNVQRPTYYVEVWLPPRAKARRVPIRSPMQSRPVGARGSGRLVRRLRCGV